MLSLQEDTCLIHAWEALYAQMIRSFVAAIPSFSDFEVICPVWIWSGSKSEYRFNRSLPYCAASSNRNVSLWWVQHVWRFWSNFVLHNCFCYVGLLLAIRIQTGTANVAVLSTYDHPCYQKLLPRHIADLQSYPSKVLKCLNAGRFTVKVKGGRGHAVALAWGTWVVYKSYIEDGCCKAKQSHTLYLWKTTLFLSYCIKAQKNFTSQLFPPTPETPLKLWVLDDTMTTKQWEANINQMRFVVHEHNLLLPHAPQQIEAWSMSSQAYRPHQSRTCISSMLQKPDSRASSTILPTIIYRVPASAMLLSDTISYWLWFHLNLALSSDPSHCWTSRERACSVTSHILRHK